MRAAWLRLQQIKRLHMLEATHAKNPAETLAAWQRALEPEPTAEAADASLDQLIATAQARK